MKHRREPPEALRVRARKVLRILRKQFPAASTALRHTDPFQLLVATILSAQCTDQRVNMVTPGLFARYPTPRAFAEADLHELEAEIKSTGFFRMKARNIQGCSRGLVDRFNGQVPQTLEELITLPGVGRKTANVVLGQAFGIVSGVVVDTHVDRLSRLMGFTSQKTPEKIELDLMEVFQKKDWIELSSILILHGRQTCNARKPKCETCPVSDLCPSSAV